MGQILYIEHIVPRATGGKTKRENLWLACPLCNEFKLDQTHARDPLTGRRARLFNPRKQKWTTHFAWSEDGTEIMGLTACGRATVLALRLNHPIAVQARENWAQAGWWPPED
jgi:hypothetical protein